MAIGHDFFGPWEEEVTDWAGALEKINRVIDRAGHSRTLAWRGVGNAGYALHSSAYRWLIDSTGALPDETQLVALETEIVRRARTMWRFDQMPALEILAHIQHFGGPTRLIDVTFNPLIALWFAVEKKYQSGVAQVETDGRLLAFDVSHRDVTLDRVWASREVPWSGFERKTWRRTLPRVWRPPSYNERIPAQNSAFLIGGVPLMYAGDNSKYYRKGPGQASTPGLWTIEEVRHATSVPVRMNSLARAAVHNATPTYTLRISQSAREEIRYFLEGRVGFSASTLYPDLYGLALNVANNLAL